VPAYSRFPEEKVIGPTLRLSSDGICIKLLTLRGRPDYGFCSYKPFIVRLGIADGLRAMASELKTKAVEHQRCQVLR
jgi:hypothetical protein